MDFDLQEMLALYATGEWSSAALGRKYGKDHTTILHHAKKAGIVPDPNASRRKRVAPPSAKFMIPQRAKSKLAPPVVDKYAYLFDPPINPGKTYAEYQAEALKRPAEAHYAGLYTEVPYTLDAARIKAPHGATL